MHQSSFAKIKCVIKQGSVVLAKSRRKAPERVITCDQEQVHSGTHKPRETGSHRQSHSLRNECAPDLSEVSLQLQHSYRGKARQWTYNSESQRGAGRKVGNNDRDGSGTFARPAYGR